jgi:hypothetical protein
MLGHMAAAQAERAHRANQVPAGQSAQQAS